MAMTAASSSDESSPRLKRTIVSSSGRAQRLQVVWAPNSVLSLARAAVSRFLERCLRAKARAQVGSAVASPEAAIAQCAPRAVGKLTPYHRGIRYLQARIDTFTRRRGPLRETCSAAGQPRRRRRTAPDTLRVVFIPCKNERTRATLVWAHQPRRALLAQNATHRIRWTRTRFNTAQRYASRRGAAPRDAEHKKRCPRND